MLNQKVLPFYFLGNYFILVQLEETDSFTGLKKSQKFRTEIDFDTQFPNFLKNYFEYNGVNISNKLVIKIGIFKSEINSLNGQDNLINSNYLFSNSKLIGSNELIITEELLKILRKHKWVEKNFDLKQIEKMGHESGHVFFTIRVKPDTLEMKISNDNVEIENNFYDPFENDQNIIKEKLKNIIVLNEEKQMNIFKVSKSMDEMNSKIKLIAIDKNNTINELSLLENENIQLKKSINKIENYDELHIELELLSNSTQGIAILEKRYAILLSQRAFQNQIKMELEQEYLEIDSILSKIKIIKEKTENLKSANKELHFNLERQMDLLPLISSYEHKIKENEKIISDLKLKINQQLLINEEEIKKREPNITTNEEINKRIKFFYDERKRLEEKKIQLQLYNEINEGGSNFEDVDDIKKYQKICGNGLDSLMNRLLDESVKENFEKMKENIKQLQIEEKELSDMVNFSIKETDLIIEHDSYVKNQNLIGKKNELCNILESLEQRDRILIDELNSSNMFYRQSILRLKHKIEQTDQYIFSEYKNTKNKGRANNEI